MVMLLRYSFIINATADGQGVKVTVKCFTVSSSCNDL